ncbi:tol-pal system protein YbgF [Legionella sp.]|uniref:tol-pal system protein YbgF n=1 Tax=Legionella sp. TaxID=459 RepID=UPI003CC495A7
MINCKKHFIAAGFMLMLPLVCWSEAPVVDESDNFASIDRQQAYEEAPVAGSKYNESQFESAQNDGYSMDSYQGDDGSPLAKDDQVSNSGNNVTLVNKIQSLQQELQELRGQLEVQAHDLKLLQQQQVAFYKDLDMRLNGNASTSTKISAPTKSLAQRLDNSKESAFQTSAAAGQSRATGSVVSTPALVVPVSRENPADEQISYLAAYELVKNRRYDEAITSMKLFAQKYPRGGYTANAHYWLGELYLVKKNYAQAVEHFNVVLQQFATSSKSAASMLKMGYAYGAMGNKSEAKKYLQQVVRAYPGTPTAQLASSKLRAI